MASRSPDTHVPAASIQGDAACQDNKQKDPSDRVPRPTTIPRFPRRHASIDTPREVPLPSPSLLQQDAVSPFAVTFDSMDATSPFFTSRTTETVSGRPHSPSLSASTPHQMLPHATLSGNAITTPISENEQEASAKPTPPVERSLSSSSSSSGITSLSLFDKPPALAASLSSSSSTSIESVASASSDPWHNCSAVKSFNDSTAYGNGLSSSTFSSYTSNGLGSAYARPARPASPSPYLTRHSSISLQFRGLSMHSSSSSYYLPPPEPPIILPPDPDTSENDDQNESDPCGQNLGSNRQAPHVPFLNRGPPPTDSYIEVETTPRDYRIHVKLPGFGRDGITLATKKRRILHIVADQWEGVGGHFERRISFGYDADLVQVRAEFDGEMLLVNVPRRPPSLGFGIWYF